MIALPENAILVQVYTGLNVVIALVLQNFLFNGVQYATFLPLYIALHNMFSLQILHRRMKSVQVEKKINTAI